MAAGQDPLVNAGVVKPLRAFVVLLLIVGGLWVLDWSLEKAELNELNAEARRTYLEGSELLRAGHPEPAIDLLRRAHALERKNSVYELTLVDALIAAGKTAEAGPLLEEMLERESNDGRANLTMARFMASEGRLAESEAYYHRAIYGKWPGRADSSRRAARIELIDFLVKQDRKEELLAELLPLQEEAGNDGALRKRVAHLLLVAGSASRAADAYRALIERNPTDASLYSGLGEAELLQGRYRPAVAAFVAAFRHGHNDSSVRHRMEFASLMAGLDPTPRQLPSVEKYRRSLHILDLTRAAYDECRARKSEPPSAGQPAHITNELAEEKLALAEQIWRDRLSACGASTSAGEEPLRLIMAKLAQ